MRILWISNAPWAGSGYGQQTDIFTRRFLEAGHDVAIVANHGLQEKATNWHGIQVFPKAGDDSIQTFAKHFKSDINILLYDTWVMNPDDWPEISMAMWAPIDHFPIVPEVLKVLSHPRVRPIAMSRYGENLMVRNALAGVDLDPLYVPHGVETDVFRPMPELKAGVRAALEIPEDAFVVGMVAANSGWNKQVARKSFPQAFDAFGRFLKKHKDAYIYVHSRMHGGAAGMDLVRLARAMEIPSERFRSPEPNAWHLGIMDNEFVAGLYNAFDVLLNPSVGEGFGIPIIEAQACGVPVIASDHSAMTELTQNGWLVTGDRWWDELQPGFGLWPSIGSILECLELAYENRENQELKDAARQFGLTYDADRVMERYWVPVLEKLNAPREVGPLPKSDEVRVTMWGHEPAPNINGNRAQRRAAKRGQR